MSELALLTFRTTFRVMAADRALAEAAISAGLTPTPEGISSPCGLSLRLDANMLPQALAKLAAAKVEVAAAYVKKGATWRLQA